MAKKEKTQSKQRIFDAALSLFARKGYDAVGIREIAKAAKVNISMLNYYYGGKIGILKAIVNEFYEKYYTAVGAVYEEDISPEKTVKQVIRNVVEFHRSNWELIMVAFHTAPIEIPEILDLKLKWAASKRKGAVDFFARLGIDTDDVVVTSVLRGLLTTLIGEHFQSRHIWEHILKSPEQKKYTEEHKLQEITLTYDDAYYEKYADALATLYFEGVCGLGKRKTKKRGGRDV